jgi:O-antigen/teichoic acid export membrane protein
MNSSTFVFWKPVIKSASIATGNKVFSVLIRFATVPLLLSYLGVERYGLLLTISSISAYAMLLDFGVGSALVNELTLLYANDANEKANYKITNGFLFLVSIALLTASATIFALSHIDVSQLLRLSTETARSEALPSIWVACSIFFLQLPLSLILKIPYTMQKGATSEVALLAGNLMSSVGLIYCVFTERSLPFVVFFLSGATAFASIGLLIYLLFHGDVRFVSSFRGGILDTFKSIRGISFHFLIMQSVWTLLNTVPYSMLAFYHGAGAVAPFGLMSQIMLAIQTPVLVLMQPMWTKIVEIVALQRHDLLNKIISQYLRLTSLYSLVAIFILIALVNPILQVLIHNKLYISLEMRIAFSIWCVCGLIAGGGMGTILLAIGETAVLSRVCILQLMLFVACSITLVPVMEGVGLVISLVSTYLISIPVMTRTIKDRFVLSTELPGVR